MKSQLLKAVLLAGLPLLGASAANAITIHPEGYYQIYTEGKRATTLDGADVSGFAALRRNRDVDLFNIGRLRQGQSALLAGRVAGTGRDSFVSRRVTGQVGVNVLNFGQSTRKGRGPFQGLVEVLVGGAVVDSVTLNGTDSEIQSYSFVPVTANDEDVELRVTSATGASDYDIELVVSDAQRSPSPVPLPAGAPLVLIGLGALAFAGYRRKERTPH